MDPSASLPEQIRALRYRLKLSQEGFGGCIGVTSKTVHRWETGQSQPSPIAFETLVKLAKENRIYDRANAIDATRPLRFQKIKRIDLLYVRLCLRLTQVELAAALQVDVKTVQRWEQGRTQPSPLYLKKIRQLQETLPVRKLRIPKAFLS